MTNPFRWKLMLAGFLIIGGFFLLAEHRAHVVPYLPFLLVAACPLMHLFGHGHGHHGSTSRNFGRGAEPDHSHSSDDNLRGDRPAPRSSPQT